MKSNQVSERRAEVEERLDFLLDFTRSPLDDLDPLYTPAMLKACRILLRQLASPVVTFPPV